MAACVPVKRVANLANPVNEWHWDCPGMTSTELRQCLRTVQPIAVPVGNDGTAEEHVGRIKHLIENGWTDAIHLDVGTPILGYWGPSWPVTDGNHRLSAAILRGDATILVEITGQLDHAAELLGMSERDLDERAAVTKKQQKCQG